MTVPTDRPLDLSVSQLKLPSQVILDYAKFTVSTATNSLFFYFPNFKSFCQY